MTAELVQGTDAWLAARCGSLGASQVHMAIARTKTGWGASRDNIMAQLIAERMTGRPTEMFVNDAMRWGTANEPQARSMFALETGHDVIECGLYRHPTIAGSHASPDGLIGDAGLIEIKCPQTSTHIETLLSGSIDGKYITQINWQMAVTGRQYAWFASFDPRMPPELQLWTKRVERDDATIKTLEQLVADFVGELKMRLARLEALRAA